MTRMWRWLGGGEVAKAPIADDPLADFDGLYLNTRAVVELQHAAIVAMIQERQKRLAVMEKLLRFASRYRRHLGPKGMREVEKLSQAFIEGVDRERDIMADLTRKIAQKTNALKEGNRK